MHEDFVYSDGTRLLESLGESWEWSTRRRRKTESCRNTVGSTLSDPAGRSNRITGFLCYFVCFQNSPIFFRYLKDFFSSVLDLAWSRTLLGFAASFLLSWFIFAAFWSELFFVFFICIFYFSTFPPLLVHLCYILVRTICCISLFFPRQMGFNLLWVQWTS